ncbi:restriction endonuclease Eco29kI [Achromobacter piechaudii]|uniref:Eco29kI family restriction endonuclease n=1 Tax=Achromobacter piechaudii TaxID=72556 RepID=UPI0006805582|nr:Eco29kI family restriction endonuclease [Achromobacter piechaudii]KNY09963.1 restriction endonuclease Eco29kI [Achromobacter piechaudii]
MNSKSHKAEIIPFNPLDKKNLGASVAEALVSQPAHPLGAMVPFFGAGIYAIYYHGQHEAYGLISEHNRADLANPSIPIYVGKAVPQGARKGKVMPDPTRSKALFGRLQEHAESIVAAGSLSIDDFTCRYLVVDEIWIPLGESLMIAKFSPLWNLIVEGFGNHDPGAGRYNGLRPRWDTLHPGRAWALKCKERSETEVEITREVKNHLANTSLPETPHFVGRHDL